jgi:hypothetical protein
MPQNCNLLFEFPVTEFVKFWWDFCSSGMLHSISRWLVTDVSEQPNRPIAKGQGVQEEFSSWSAWPSEKRRELTTCHRCINLLKPSGNFTYDQV